MTQLINFLNSNAVGITLILTAIAGIFKFWQYVDIKRSEWRQKNFENFHRLIKELVQSDTPGEDIKLDRQIAVVYELRNFSKYFDISIRILEGWLDREKKDPLKQKNFGRLYKEMELTIKYIKSKI